MKTKCARCGKPMKYNGAKWWLHEKCKTKGEIKVAKKLNQRLNQTL
jgi:tRNA(Ile2) C34 agmatinyltransferase TiaS